MARRMEDMSQMVGRRVSCTSGRAAARRGSQSCWLSTEIARLPLAPSQTGAWHAEEDRLLALWQVSVVAVAWSPNSARVVPLFCSSSLACIPLSVWPLPVCAASRPRRHACAA